MGYRTALIYDDTTDTLNRQYAAFTSLPSWAHAQLAPNELAAELRDQRIAAFDAKFAALAALEERAFLDAKAAAAKGAPPPPPRAAAAAALA